MRPSIADEAAAVCFLVKMEHPQGTIYACTALETIEWDGQDWIGIGLFGSIEGLDESTNVEVREVTFSVSGSDDDLIAGLADSVKGYQATIWHVLLDSRNRVVGDPEVIDIVDLDEQNYTVSADGTATLSITGYSAIVDYRTSPDTYYTPEMQRARYPGDSGLDRIPALVDRQVSWQPVSP
jgi:Flp pilus assembly secretin CpaC